MGAVTQSLNSLPPPQPSDGQTPQPTSGKAQGLQQPMPMQSPFQSNPAFDKAQADLSQLFGTGQPRVGMPNNYATVQIDPMRNPMVPNLPPSTSTPTPTGKNGKTQYGSSSNPFAKGAR